MKNFKQHIYNSLFANPEEIAKEDVIIKPKNRAELIQIIEDEVKKYRYGETVDLNFIDVSNITCLDKVFESLKQYKFDVSEWNVSNVITAVEAFEYCTLFDGDLSKWNFKHIADISFMFWGCQNFTGKGLENWNINDNLVTCNYVFYKCNSLKKIPSWYKKND